jgi:hypothetical protein
MKTNKVSMTKTMGWWYIMFHQRDKILSKLRSNMNLVLYHISIVKWFQKGERRLMEDGWSSLPHSA